MRARTELVSVVAIVVAAGASGVIGYQVAELGEDDDDGRGRIDFVEVEAQDGDTFRCLVASSGLWCERTFPDVPDVPSLDCGPEGDLPCEEPSTTTVVPKVAT